MSAESTIKDVSKIFSATYLLDMLSGNNLTHFKNVYSTSNFDKNTSIKYIFDKCYKTLTSHYRNEYVYKNILIKNLIANELHSDYALFSEMDIGKNSRLDIAHFSHSNHAFEIKTELDSFARLEKQLTDYTKGFEYIWLVVPEISLKKAINSIDSKTGIKVLDNHNNISTFREATSSLNEITHGGLFSLLREKEFLYLIKKLSISSVNSSSLQERQKHIQSFKEIDIEKAHKETISIIKNRTQQQSFDYVLKTLPQNLLPIGLNLKVQKEIKKLLSMLNFSISEFENHIDMVQHRKFFDFS